MTHHAVTSHLEKPDTALPGSAQINRAIAVGLEFRSKVLATLGPSSDAPEMVGRLIDAGARVFRLNFSHGSHEEHAARVATIRAVSKEKGIEVAILQDLSGPKMRIGELLATELELAGGSRVFLSKEDSAAAKQFADHGTIVPIPGIPIEGVRLGDRVLLADGRVVMYVEEARDDGLVCRVLATGLIRPRSGIALPDSQINLPATTSKDLDDLRYGLSLGVNYVALSFVAGPDDVAPARDILRDSRSSAQLISKIERHEALRRIDEILAVSDGIMVARGDLGIDIPFEQVPLEQDRLVRLAREQQKPCIIATQMLETMIHEPRPTRAEATDVFYGGRLAADAVMLSGETAVGKFPAEAVDTMRRLVRKGAESFEELLNRIDRQHHGAHDLVPGDYGIGRLVAAAAQDPSVVAIVVCTTTGKSARLVASHRPHAPIFALSTEKEAVQSMNLLWGVTPLQVSPTVTSDEEVTQAVCVTRPYVETFLAGNAQGKGPAILVVCGATPGIPGSTSVIRRVEV